MALPSAAGAGAAAEEEEEDEPLASPRLPLLTTTTTTTTLSSACCGLSAAPPAMVPSEENQLVPKEVRRSGVGSGETSGRVARGGGCGGSRGVREARGAGAGRGGRGGGPARPGSPSLSPCEARWEGGRARLCEGAGQPSARAGPDRGWMVVRGGKGRLFRAGWCEEKAGALEAAGELHLSMSRHAGRPACVAAGLRPGRRRLRSAAGRAAPRVRGLVRSPPGGQPASGLAGSGGCG